MKSHLILLALALSLMAATPVLSAGNMNAQGSTGGPQYFPIPSSGGTPLPFSEAVRLGDTLYVSGQTASIPGKIPGTRTIEPRGIRPEARRALEKIKAILERHGSSLDHVLKCTVFLADIREWEEFNEIYREFFKTNFPARSAMGVSGLALDARVEVECIASMPPKK